MTMAERLNNYLHHIEKPIITVIASFSFLVILKIKLCNFDSIDNYLDSLDFGEALDYLK